MSFRWSLGPMLRWMQCIGIFLEFPAKKPSMTQRIWVTSLGLIVFFFNSYRNGMALVGLFTYLTDPVYNFTIHIKQFGSASIGNMAIGMISQAMVTFLSQLFLMSVAVTKWPKLVEVLCEMEHRQFFQPKDFKCFRTFFIIGLFSLITGYIILFSTLVFPFMVSSDASITEILWNASIPFLFVYTFSGSILFSCLGWIASHMLKILADRVENSRFDKKKDWNSTIDCWKYQNYKIAQLIDSINCVFGPFILVVIMFCFIMTINSSFNAMLSVSGSICCEYLVTNLLILLIILGYISFVIYVPHRLRSSGYDLSKKLRALEMSNPSLQAKVNFLVLEVLHTLPRITALGLFDIDLRLIPTLVGTTLTYLIILCQFQYSEK